MVCLCGVREREIHTVLGNIERMHSAPFRIKLGQAGLFYRRACSYPNPRCGRWSRRHMQIILFGSELYSVPLAE